LDFKRSGKQIRCRKATEIVAHESTVKAFAIEKQQANKNKIKAKKKTVNFEPIKSETGSSEA
jgi:hypothetical protein